MEYDSAVDHAEHMAMMDAKAAFNKDQSIRRWAADHGGVYVEIRPGVSPSPYLKHLKERDVTTPSGKMLTLINPATMLKQIMNDYAELYGVKGMIVSMAPLNPDNMAIGWEIDAITKLENGAPQVSSFLNDKDGKENFHFMSPMVTTQSCLYCHEFQGYQLGDIIGGVGVVIPMKKYRDDIKDIIISNAITHGTIFIIGILGLLAWHNYNSRQFIKQLKAERDLKESNDRFANFTRYSPNKIHIKDIHGRYIMLNPKSEKIFGISNEEATGKTAQDIFPQEHGYPFTKHDVDVAEKGIAIEREEIFGTGEDERTYLTVKFPIHDASGKIVSVGSSGVDITERKKAEKELMEHRDHLEELVKERTKELEDKNKELDNA
ncbi:MAG: PAS domain-containing protein, partial [Rhodospirillaceae bacterium]|nr:PAS domain-containing protein [Rhodospirillaceae bacterium]